jgi:hypothetical protein
MDTGTLALSGKVIGCPRYRRYVDYSCDACYSEQLHLMRFGIPYLIINIIFNKEITIFPVQQALQFCSDFLLPSSSSASASSFLILSRFFRLLLSVSGNGFFLELIDTQPFIQGNNFHLFLARSADSGPVPRLKYLMKYVYALFFSTKV